MVYILHSLNKWCLISARIAGFCLILAFCSLEIKTTVLCRLTQALPPCGAAERAGGDGGEDPEQKAGRRWPAAPKHTWLRELRGGSYHRMGNPSPKSPSGGLPAVASGQSGAWRSPPGRSNGTGLPPLHCAEGAGGLAVGSGWGDPAEGGAWERKQKEQRGGWGGGWVEYAAGQAVV